MDGPERSDMKSLVRRVGKPFCTRMRWPQKLISITDLHGVMNGELSSLLERGLQEFVLAGAEEKVRH